jgi:sec-independent protein translocase protein TatA
MFGLGTPELIIILLIILLLFGGRKLPELARSFGDSMKELRKGMSDDEKATKKKDTTTKADDKSKSA